MGKCDGIALYSLHQIPYPLDSHIVYSSVFHGAITLSPFRTIQLMIQILRSYNIDILQILSLARHRKRNTYDGASELVTLILCPSPIRKILRLMYCNDVSGTK